MAGVGISDVRDRLNMVQVLGGRNSWERIHPPGGARSLASTGGREWWFLVMCVSGPGNHPEQPPLGTWVPSDGEGLWA